MPSYHLHERGSLSYLRIKRPCHRQEAPTKQRCRGTLRQWGGCNRVAAELHVAVIGAGNIGTVHAQTALVADCVGRVSAADPVPARRERVRRLGVDRVVSEYAELFSEDPPDVAVVAVPPDLHEPITMDAIAAGCHVFVEKPLARTPEETADMVAAADRAGVSLGVDHTMRYQPGIARLKEIYEAGELGAVPTATIWRINNGPFDPPPAESGRGHWALDPETAGGGALLDLGVHLFDVLDWFFGEVSLEHAAIGQVLQLPVEDRATLVVSTEAGTVATLTCGFFQWERPPEITGGLRLDGIASSRSSETYRPDDWTSHAARSAFDNVIRRLRRSDPAYFRPTYYYEAHHRALTSFLDAVAAGSRPPVSGTDGHRMVSLVHEAYGYAEEKEAPIEVMHA